MQNIINLIFVNYMCQAFYFSIYNTFTCCRTNASNHYFIFHGLVVQKKNNLLKECNF